MAVRWFQFTHPGRGATLGVVQADRVARVSIHAPREGCDNPIAPCATEAAPVSIHAPREGCDWAYLAHR